MAKQRLVLTVDGDWGSADPHLVELVLEYQHLSGCWVPYGTLSPLAAAGILELVNNDPDAY
jgi:hypothetical protein